MAQPVDIPMAQPYHPPPPPPPPPPVAIPTQLVPSTTAPPLPPGPPFIRLRMLGTGCVPWMQGFKIIHTSPPSTATGRWANCSLVGTVYDPIRLAAVPPEVHPPVLAVPPAAASHPAVRYCVVARRVTSADDAMNALGALYNYNCGPCARCSVRPRPPHMSVDRSLYLPGIVWARICSTRCAHAPGLFYLLPFHASMFFPVHCCSISHTTPSPVAALRGLPAPRRTDHVLLPLAPVYTRRSSSCTFSSSPPCAMFSCFPSFNNNQKSDPRVINMKCPWLSVQHTQLVTNHRPSPSPCVTQDSPGLCTSIMLSQAYIALTAGLTCALQIGPLLRAAMSILFCFLRPLVTYLLDHNSTLSSSHNTAATSLLGHAYALFRHQLPVPSIMRLPYRSPSQGTIFPSYFLPTSSSGFVPRSTSACVVDSGHNGHNDNFVTFSHATTLPIMSGTILSPLNFSHWVVTHSPRSFLPQAKPLTPAIFMYACHNYVKMPSPTHTPGSYPDLLILTVTASSSPSTPTYTCNESLDDLASPLPPIFQNPQSPLPLAASVTSRIIWHITGVPSPVSLPPTFRLTVVPNFVGPRNILPTSPSTPSTIVAETPPVSPQVPIFSLLLTVLPVDDSTPKTPPFSSPAHSSTSSSTPPISPTKHWTTIGPRLTWTSTPSLILSAVSDTDRESDDGWHDLAEFVALDLPFSRERYYADLAHHFPPRATRANDLLYFIPPWPEHRDYVRRSAATAYPQVEQDHARATNALREAYVTTGSAPAAVWSRFMDTQQQAESTLLQATDLRSLPWPLHPLIIEPTPPFPDDSRAHQNARLVWQHLSHADREWLMQNLPTLAMVIAESQHCYINIDSYRTTASPPILSPQVPPSPLPNSPPTHSPSFSEMMAVQNSSSLPDVRSLPHPSSEGPDHMYKSFLLDDVPSMILVDTGATASLVRMSYLTPDQQSRVTQPPEPIKLLGASGHRIEILGQLPMTISRDGIAVIHMFAVCNDSLPTPIILGLDFLRLHVHVIYPDTGRVVMKGSNAKSIGPPAPPAIPPPPRPPVSPARPLVACLPSLLVKSGEAAPVFAALPQNNDWKDIQVGDTVLVEPVDSLTADTGLCALPLCQTVTLHKGTLGVFYLVANPSKADVRNPKRAKPRAATITKVQHDQLDRSDDYLMQPVYQAWFLAAAGLPPSDIDKFQELYGRGRVAMDTNISAGHWWINPPWNQLSAAMQKIQTERPESFLIFGPSAKSTP